jgi:hypothetical protein
LAMFISTELLSPVNSQSEFLDWKVVASWIETEGSISSTIVRRQREGYYPYVARQIHVVQVEREPLDALSDFLGRHGVYSFVRSIKPSHTAFRSEPYFRLEIYRTNDIDRVIAETSPYLLTNKAKSQIRKYHELRSATSQELRALLDATRESTENLHNEQGGPGA